MDTHTAERSLTHAQWIVLRRRRPRWISGVPPSWDFHRVGQGFAHVAIWTATLHIHDYGGGRCRIGVPSSRQFGELNDEGFLHMVSPSPNSEEWLHIICVWRHVAIPQGCCGAGKFVSCVTRVWSVKLHLIWATRSRDRPPWLKGLRRHESLQRQASFQHDETVAKLHVPHPVFPRSPSLVWRGLWDQTLVSGLMLLTFMTIHLFQFQFAGNEQYWHSSRLITLKLSRTDNNHALLVLVCMVWFHVDTNILYSQEGGSPSSVLRGLGIRSCLLVWCWSYWKTRPARTVSISSRCSSTRKWRYCTFLHSVQCSPSLPRNLQFMFASRLKATVFEL